MRRLRVPWSKTEKRWRDALCAAMIPESGNSPLPGLGAVHDDAFWREYEEAAPDLLRFGFRASVWALTFSPILYLRTARRFGQLDGEERDQLLDEIANSRFYLLRQFPLTIKILSCFSYLGDEHVRSQVEELNKQ